MAREGRLPAAVFAGDDNIALGVLNALLEEGIRVPEQVAIVGYDDQYISSKRAPFDNGPAPADRIGLAARISLKRMDGTMKRGAMFELTLSSS